jgi:D-alanyl-D-alanine carboxypeptidase
LSIVNEFLLSQDYFCFKIIEMRKVYLFSFLTILAAISSCSKIPFCDCMGREEFPTNSFIDDTKAKSISEITCQFINNEDVPAIQISIIDSLGNIWTLSTGNADKKRKTILNDEHIFRLASITKVFTGTVIFKLIDEGKLNLTDKLIDYYPEYTNAPNVTIGNLLDHSSGIKELLTLPDILMSGTINTDKIWDINQIVSTIGKKNLVFETGSDHQYSNTNTVLLGLIAEKVTGKKMSDLYNELIFNNLNLNNIVFCPYNGTPEKLISGYDRKLLPTPGLYEVTSENTAWATSAFTSGALVANSEETALFFHHLLMGNIISEQSLNVMKSFEAANNPQDEHLEFFGKALFKWDINGNLYYGHEGLFVGFDNILSFREKDKTTIVILSNMSSFNKFNLLSEIDKIIE